MKRERDKPMIDKFGLVQEYQNATSKEDFLYMLMNLEAVQAQSSMMAYIRQILQTIREYARHRTLALAKGLVLSIFPGRGKETAKEYERFEDTPEFTEQMDSLWKALGIDYDAYSDREAIRQHDELSETLKAQGYDEKAFSRMEYDAKAHIFSVPEVLTTEERSEEPVRWRSFAVLSKMEYERFQAYMEDRSEEHTEAAEAQQIKVFDTELLSGDIIVAAEAEILRGYLAEIEAADIDEPHPDTEEERQEETDEVEQEKNSVDSFAEWLDRICASGKRCEKLGLSHTAAAVTLFLQKHGLEKRDGQWVKIVTEKTGVVHEKPLTEDLIKSIDRDREARLLNMSYRSESLEKDDRESRMKQEEQMHLESEISVNRAGSGIER